MQQHGLEPPLFWTPFVALTLLLADVLSLEKPRLVVWHCATGSTRALVGVTVLLTATAAHACRLHQHRVQAHTLLVAPGAATMGAMLLAFNAPPGSLPLVIALEWWTVAGLALRAAPVHGLARGAENLAQPAASGRAGAAMGSPAV